MRLPRHAHPWPADVAAAPRRSRWNRSAAGRGTAARSSCWKVPSASKAAGGTAATSSATTTSRKRRHWRACCGSTANARARAMVPARNLRMNRAPYAELHCLSNFSFLRGASHAEELVRAGERARLHGAGHHRRMLAGRRGARAHGREEDRRHQAAHRRGVHARLRAAPGDHRAQPRRLRAPVAAHHARARQAEKGSYSAHARRRGGVPV